MALREGNQEDVLHLKQMVHFQHLYNANINKQLWFINHITCSDFRKRTPENRRSMGDL